ncbi:putative zinc-binding metallopeptidase [Zunongwangia sp. F260]|uniref:Zinc-binding metallopeptidase n=1 Tax=Autumnicola lenta TaxID=3075593 RepID=A0ABU3CFQ6_9FLAO|nr:putative zinc-binding metallopeptidase [Zunongwangia sp. F260]MDT0645182.1 putative zinc-binding metallopeptidase [Zunongwangia sp. F260]
MKIFNCNNCNNIIFFENDICGYCNSLLGYCNEEEKIIAANPGTDFRENRTTLKYCRNHEHSACNWLIPENSGFEYCEACQLNSVIPNIGDEKRLEEWRLIEFAKHRLIYSLNKLQLPFVFQQKDRKDLKLQFRFLGPGTNSKNGQQVLTGHLNGVITLNVEEADDLKREKARMQMGEKMRTLLGHFRHEIGHFYWEAIILPNQENLRQFREIFGDERKNYSEALQEYYKKGPAKDWREFFITKYASSHPWEDWAETWAHYLHIMDTVETAYYFGVKTEPKVSKDKQLLSSGITINPYKESDFDAIVNEYISLTIAINSLNRGMGLSDIYPFILNNKDISKLGYIHNLLLNNQGKTF